MNTVISFIGLVAVLAMAYGFDRWDTLFLRQAKESFNLSPYVWFLSITNLILAGSILTLAWFVSFRDNKRWLISAVFLLIGLLGTFAFPATRGVPFFSDPTSRVAYVAAFVTVIGIARIFLPKND